MSVDQQGMRTDLRALPKEGTLAPWPPSPLALQGELNRYNKEHHLCWLLLEILRATHFIPIEQIGELRPRKFKMLAWLIQGQNPWFPGCALMSLTFHGLASEGVMAMMEPGQGSGGRLSVRVFSSIPSGKASACPHRTGRLL